MTGRRHLRLGNEIVNIHSGPLDLRPRAQDCDGNGDRTDDRTTYQRIYRDRNGDGYFTRDTDTAFRTVRAGCMHFHPAHDHWHFDDFALYALRAYRADGSIGSVIRSSGKVSYCVGDNYRRFGWLAGSPARGYYGRPATGCKRDDVMGLSTGWGDLYGALTPGQFIDITNVRDGVYCLVSRADPLNKIVERNERNNRQRIRIRLTAGQVAWRPYRRC